MIFVNGKLSESHNINPRVPQSYLVGSNLSLLYINYPPKSLHLSLVSIYADDKTV